MLTCMNVHPSLFACRATIVGNTGGGDDDGEVVFDTTRAGGRPLVFMYSLKPPSSQNANAGVLLCRGVLQGFGGMKQGGKRVLIVPPSLAFGDGGATLADGVVVAPNATLRVTIDLSKVSIPPS